MISLRRVSRPACQALGDFMDVGLWGVLWRALGALTTG